MYIVPKLLLFQNDFTSILLLLSCFSETIIIIILTHDIRSIDVMIIIAICVLFNIMAT